MKRRRVKGVRSGALDISKEAPDELISDEETPQEENVEQHPGNSKAVIYFIAFLVLVLGAVFINMAMTKKEVQNEYMYTYNGFTMINVSGFWQTQIQNPNTGELKNLEMRLDPRSVEDIPVTSGIVETILSSERIYLTVSPDLTSKSVIGMTEVAKVLSDRVGLYNIPTKGALTQVLIDDGTPQITCENATDTTRVLHFLVAENSAIAADGNCILVAGTDEDEIIRSSVKLSYMLLGII